MTRPTIPRTPQEAEIHNAWLRGVLDRHSRYLESKRRLMRTPAPYTPRFINPVNRQNAGLAHYTIRHVCMYLAGQDTTRTAHQIYKELMALPKTRRLEIVDRQRASMAAIGWVPEARLPRLPRQRPGRPRVAYKHYTIRHIAEYLAEHDPLPPTLPGGERMTRPSPHAICTYIKSFAPADRARILATHREIMSRLPGGPWVQYAAPAAYRVYKAAQAMAAKQQRPPQYVETLYKSLMALPPPERALAVERAL